MASGCARLGDLSSGHCFPSRPNITASSNVFINGLGSHRLGDLWGVHSCGSSSHASITVSGSSSVFVNGIPQARIGDSLSCGETILTGSSNVFSG